MGNTVILTNHLKGLRRHLRRVLADPAQPIRLLSLLDTSEGLRLQELLKTHRQVQVVDREAVVRQQRADFREQYVGLLAGLNTRNRSVTWWARPVSTKSPLSTALYRNAFYSLLVSRLLQASDEPLVVITDSHDLAAHVRTWAKGRGVRVRHAIRLAWNWKRLLKRSATLVVGYWLLKTWAIWWLTRRYRPRGAHTHGHTIVMSLLHPHSYVGTHGYRDLYFGPFLDFLGSRGRPSLLFGMFWERPWSQLRRLRTTQPPIPIVPIESCLRLRDMMACALRTWWMAVGPVRFGGATTLDGVEMRGVIQRAMRDPERLSSVFANLKVWYGARGLCRLVSVTRCVYPYENRAFEKMLLLGMRSVSPQTRMVGYQHCAIPRGYTHFMLGKEEAHETPLPDVLVTTGPVVRDWLEREGNHPAGLLRVGCALRRQRGAFKPLQRQEPHRLLVVLSSGLEEYVGVLRMIDRLVADGTGCQLKLRPHPGLGLGEALKLVPIRRTDCVSVSTGSLAEDLAWAHIVLYASSSVAFDALARGIPVIHLECGQVVDTDPLDGWERLKWRARTSEQLVEVIRQITGFPQSALEQAQDAARAYVEQYLQPVTEERLRVLSEA